MYFKPDICRERKEDCMLILSKFIGKGATRICFEHPLCSDKCVKVMARSKNERQLFRELQVYSLVKGYLSEYLPRYEPRIVKTNLGKGLVCDMLRDDDGNCSQTLGSYLAAGAVDEELIAQMWHFSYCLAEHDLFFYDFNLQNFVVQIKDGHKLLRYTDLKSYNNYKSWTFLKLEKVLIPLARQLMLHRIKRLFRTLGIDVLKA